MARLFGDDALYCCMDLDIDRVRAAHKRGSVGLVGDATRIPVVSATIDPVIQRAISHHLDDSQFSALTAESVRILQPECRLLFLDATWEPSRMRSRLLWAIDQGSHHRTEAQMRAVLRSSFEMDGSTSYAGCHRYYLAIAGKRTDDQ